MFTGLIQAMGRVVSRTPTRDGERLVVDASSWSHRPGLGESISVNGCCLTVGVPGVSLGFDVIPETLNRTTLGGLAPGSVVNLEASATPQTLLGGHIVQGHIEGVGIVEAVWTHGECRVSIRPPRALMEYMTPKGAVAIDGVSLTLASVGDGTIDVALIPTTLALTTLGTLRAGSRVNIETDILARTVVHWARHWGRAAAKGPGGSRGKSKGKRAGARGKGAAGRGRDRARRRGRGA